MKKTEQKELKFNRVCNNVYDVFCKCKLNKSIVLSGGESLKHRFTAELDDRFNYKLRVRGEVDIPYTQRTEDIYPVYFRKLDDSLKKIDGKYALVFDDFNRVKERSCYYMCRFFSKGSGERCEFSVKYKNFSSTDHLYITLEIYYGQNKTRYYYEKPNETVSIPLVRSETFTVLKKEIICQEETDFIMVKICGTDFDGYAEIFTPSLLLNGKELIDQFSYEPKLLEGLKWIGEGFSLTERPIFSLSVNGKEVFSGHKTDRLQCLYGCDFDLPWQTLYSENNSVELKYSVKNAIPYRITELQLITTPKNFEILGVQPTITTGKMFGALCYFPRNSGIDVICPEGGEYIGEKTVKQGVSVLKFVQNTDGEANIFTVFACGAKREFCVSAFSKIDDGVLTGSGDFIYINQNLNDFTEYLAWYLNNGIGNMLTLRSSYRWGMTSEADENFWRKAVKILNDLNLKYPLMVDGRELNGANANPSEKMLRGDGFLGEQTHERDGAYTYWTQNLDESEELFYHILSRKIQREGQYGKRSPVYDKSGKAQLFYAGDDISDMKSAYELLIKNLARTAKGGATRHTGVTPYFSCFLKAGYKWVGYENMYGPQEILLGALRGMTNSKGIKNFGTHLALQWSTAPSSDAKHAVRYRLALYLSYMHGATEINTEEGLWNIEFPFAAFDRFSLTCRNHRKEQADFYRFILSHERKGRMHTDIAMMVGLYDGMDCFSTNRVYGCYGDKWKYASPEKSWNLLKVFYPKADVNAIYCYLKKGGKENLNEREKEILNAYDGLYKPVNNNRSLGYYSDTPFGAIDIIDAEAENLSDYKFIFFTGWNTCTEGQIERLISFMKQGGTVMLTKAHLYDTADRSMALGGNAKVIKTPLLNEFLSYQETGKLFYFDKGFYPYDISEEYSDKLRFYGGKFGSEYVKEVNSVSFTEYKDDFGNITLYLLDINWWEKKAADCVLNFGGNEYRITLGGNKMRIVRIPQDNKIAVMSLASAIDTSIISETEIQLKGYGETTLTVFKNGIQKVLNISVSGKTTLKM